MSYDEPRYVTPTLDDPYPERDDWAHVDNFRYMSPLHLYRARRGIRFGTVKRGADYVVAQPYSVEIDIDGETKRITVPAGMLTDLASVPTAVRSVVGRVGRHLEASIVHDFLYIAWQDLENRKPTKRNRKYADRVFKAGLEAADSRVKGVIVCMVRWFGRSVFEGTDQPRYIDPEDIEPAARPLPPKGNQDNDDNQDTPIIA